MDLDARLIARLDALREAGLQRNLPPVHAREGVRYRLADREVVGFCSNDYLGLADATGFPSAPSAPGGASASRLICGDLEGHRSLETTVAEWLGYDDAVIFPSGFQLNVGVLPALVEPDDLVESDQLNHASIIDGLRLSRAGVHILPHRQPPPPRTDVAPRAHWWVTESIFSMDGDRLDLGALRSHQTHGGLAYVDEAHALGLLARGHGLTTQGTQAERPTVLVGTFSKALGCAGAFVAGSRTVAHWIRTRARSFVFSTGVSPALLPRIAHALEQVQGEQGDVLRERLWNNVARFASNLSLDADAPSPIFPLVVGDNATTLRLATSLLERGWHVQPIRPPTVPENTARLRVTLSAGHDPADIDRFSDDLLELFAAHDLAPRVARGSL